MNFGKRHPLARGAGHLVSLLVSVIALALALFVVPAQAEECTSSSCVQYSPSLPKAEGGHAPTHHQKTPAKASKTGQGGGTTPSNPGHSGETGESGEGESSPEEGGVAPGHDGGGTGQGKPGGSATNGAKEGTHPAPKSATAKPASHSDDGGSSPLVPILIAIAVLAAISVAVVMIRQRRQRSGGPKPTASPEAH